MSPATLPSKPYLTKTDEEIATQFRSLSSFADVATLLEVSTRTLSWVLYAARLREEYVETVLTKKDGGNRRVCVPPLNLRILQDKLLRVLTVIYAPKSCVTGFVRRKSVLDNAHPHVGVRFLLNFDLRDFFPSIHIGRVVGMLCQPPYSVGRKAATALGQLLTHNDGHLPQGAPTSPIVANMVCAPFDSAMLALSRQHRLTYTRYADDISLSTSTRRFPPELAALDADGICHLGPDLVTLVTSHGFSIREGKTRLRGGLRRQVVTGLVVNAFPNVPRRYVRSLRAMIHSCRKNGLAATALTHASKEGCEVRGRPEEWISNVIRGKLAYLSMVRGEDDHVVRNITRQACEIVDLAISQSTRTSDLPGQPIRRRSRREPNWALWAERYQKSVFRLKCVGANTSRDAFGTAFQIGPQRFMTAGHNVERTCSDGAVLKYDVWLSVPLLNEVQLQDIRAVSKDGGGIDLAVGTALLPEEWPQGWMRSQERIPLAGEEVAAIGFPDVAFRDVDLVMHVGRIESVMRGYGGHGAKFLSVSFASGPALSGAPLIDANGYLLGVMVENSYTKVDEQAPLRPYGQAIVLGHWRELPGAGSRLSTA